MIFIKSNFAENIGLLDCLTELFLYFQNQLQKLS